VTSFRANFGSLLGRSFMGKLTKAKAKKILKHGSIRGHKLTKKQKGFFGARAGGSPIKTKKKGRKGNGALGYSRLKGF